MGYVQTLRNNAETPFGASAEGSPPGADEAARKGKQMKKIVVDYQSGPSRYTTNGVDYMLADISALDLDRDELYAEVDPYDFIDEMGGADKIIKVLPEYEDVVREFCEEHCLQSFEDLERLECWIKEDTEDGIGVDFWEAMAKAFLGDAYIFTGPHLKEEILAQAKELGITPEMLLFDLPK